MRLINHIKTPVALVDEHMTIIDANHAYSERTGSPVKIVGRKCFDLAYHFDKPCYFHNDDKCPVTESIKTKKSATAIHHFCVDGKTIVEEITATPILEDDGEVKYVVEEFRDLTTLLNLNKGIISTCSYCHKVHDREHDNWVNLDMYVHQHTGAKFSHGICKKCLVKEHEKVS